jgi:hypothetical protein
MSIHIGTRIGRPAKLAAILSAGAAVWFGSPITPALAAGTLTLKETGRLHLTSKQGFTLNEQGAASGSITGTIYVHLRIVSTSRVTAEVNIYPRGSSITGKGSASYQRGTSTGTFTGSIAIVGGSGRYAGARGAHLRFSGTIRRSNDAITVHVSGKVTV